MIKWLDYFRNLRRDKVVGYNDKRDRLEQKNI